VLSLQVSNLLTAFRRRNDEQIAQLTPKPSKLGLSISSSGSLGGGSPGVRRRSRSRSGNGSPLPAARRSGRGSGLARGAPPLVVRGIGAGSP